MVSHHRTKTGAPVPNDDVVADQCSLCDSLTFASYLNNHGGGIGACVQVAAGYISHIRESSQRSATTAASFGRARRRIRVRDMASSC